MKKLACCNIAARGLIAAKVVHRGHGKRREKKRKDEEAVAEFFDTC
jgi:hypothetical protein